jgi:hypothetical protein
VSRLRVVLVLSDLGLSLQYLVPLDRSLLVVDPHVPDHATGPCDLPRDPVTDLRARPGVPFDIITSVIAGYL